MNLEQLRTRTRQDTLKIIDELIESIKILDSQHQKTLLSTEKEKAEFASAKEKADGIKRELQLLEKERTTMLRQKDDIDALIKERKSEVESLVQRKETLVTEIASHQSTIETVEMLGEEKKRLESSLSDLRKQVTTAQDDLRGLELKTRAHISEYEADCQKYEGRLEELRKTNEAELDKYRPLIESNIKLEQELKKKNQNLLIVEKRFKAFAEEHNLGFRI